MVAHGRLPSPTCWTVRLPSVESVESTQHVFASNVTWQDSSESNFPKWILIIFLVFFLYFPCIFPVFYLYFSCIFPVFSLYFSCIFPVLFLYFSCIFPVFLLFLHYFSVTFGRYILFYYKSGRIKINWNIFVCNKSIS